MRRSNRGPYASANPKPWSPNNGISCNSDKVENEAILAIRSSLANRSVWVRDLASLSSNVSVNSHWFWDSVVCCIGDETTTRFWHDTWVGVTNLCTKYRRLFNISLLPYGNICDFGSWIRGKWVWNFTWRRLLFNWKLDLFNSLLDEIKNMRFEKSKQYFVRSAYRTLTHQDALETLLHQHIHILWRTRAPLKIESRLRMLYLGGESLRSLTMVFYAPYATTTMNLLITSSLLATSPTMCDS
ncbi:hypothetical protein Lal_00015977 [Lupinus albus]|nr:hypothetical protein Lal_00015977 [Lupinus albus]